MEALGSRLEGARTRLALSQGALAGLLGVTQQTVSRWEQGTSRPRPNMMTNLAGVLNLNMEDIEEAMGVSRPGSRRPKQSSNGLDKSEVDSLPVRPLTSVLPFLGLTADQYERFVADLLARQFPDAEVSQLGGQGDDQAGYDILVVHGDGRRVGVQCKREKQFGPKKVAEAVGEAELQVDESIIALARAATAEARFEMDKHPGWRLWDQADQSRHIRQLAAESSLQLVQTYFPSHIEAFLGIAPASVWRTATEFYRSSSSTLLDHRQHLVGRTELINDMVSWVVDPEAVEIAVVVGRGGLGKSKLLWEIATRDYPQETHFRFLAVGQQPAPADFNLLPRTGRLVVVLDDAHTIDRVAAIIAQLWQLRREAHVLLATRPYGETELDSEIWTLNQSPRAVKRWPLEDLSQTEAIELVANLTDRPAHDLFTRQLASISADCPFLAVVAADLYRHGALAGTSLTSDGALRAEVFKRFVEQMTGRKGGTEANERRNVLSAIAAFQPVRLDDPNFEATITGLTEIDSWDTVNGRIRELEDAGLLLRRGGTSIRVVPDMFGDILFGQVAYDDRSNRLTSFLSRAQAVAVGAPLRHLIVNASRMDWQVRDGGPGRAAVVDELWNQLRVELLGEAFDNQVSLLALVAKIAYYQPEQAIELVKDLLAASPVESAGDDHAERTWSATRDEVVHATAPVLRNLAYNFEYLRPALDILWQLAQDDRRPTNQYPDHPLRVLAQIADLRTGKPLFYIDAVIDAATDWLTKRWRLSPFDVIEPILAVEGSDEVSSDRTLTFHAFSIDPASVRAVRQRVVNLAFEQADSDDIPAAVRGIETLEQAIRGPAGMFGRLPGEEEKKAWAKEFVPVIKRLGRLGADPNRDPAVRIAIRQAIDWHAEYSKTSTKRAAKQALASLVVTSEDELALCLHDGWGRTAMRTGLSFEQAEQARIAKFRRLAEEISTGKSDDEALDRLENRLHIERATSGGYNGAGLFLADFFSYKPSAAVGLCERVLGGQLPELSNFISQALAALIRFGDGRAIEFAKAMLDGDNPLLQASAGHALSWGRAGRAESLAGEDKVLSAMAAHGNELVRCAAGRAVFMIAQVDTAGALDLVTQIEFRESTKVAAETLSAFGSHGTLRWSDTTAGFRQAIVRQLVDCSLFDEYEITSAVSELSRADPLRATRLLIARIDRQTKLQRIGYDALPHHWEPPLRVHETTKLARCLIEVRDWITKRGHDRATYYLQDDGAELYRMLAGGWKDQALAILGDFGNTSTEAALVTVARILAHAPTTVLLGHVELVTRLLRRAEALGDESATLVLQALLQSAYGVSAAWTGEGLKKDEEERDRARQIAAGLPRGSIESRFFQRLAGAIADRLRWAMESPEPRYDGRDW
jgi:transcriptional regulator with XRE-family HTH domain